MELTAEELVYLGLCLEGFLFGLYSGIFAVLCQYHTVQRANDNLNTKQDVIFYSLCVLYMLSGIDFTLDIVMFVDTVPFMLYRLDACQIAVFACCDVITQSILIRRCWILWGHNFRVIIIPSILAFAFLVMWMACISSLFKGPSAAIWENVLVLTSLTASMTVNALVTGLIVFRIFKVFRRFKIFNSSDEKSAGTGTAGGREFRSVIFIIIESGMVLFTIQLTRVALQVCTIAGRSHTVNSAFDIVILIHEMINGITPTIIQLRVLMGSSFHDDPSLEEAVGSLRFARVANSGDSEARDPGIECVSQDEPQLGLGVKHDNLNPIPEMGNVIQEGNNDIGESDSTKTVPGGR